MVQTNDISGPKVSTTTFNTFLDYNQVRSNVVFVDDGVGDPNDGCDSILNVNDVSGKIVIMNRSSNCGIAG